jgi:hypothetical protein
MLESSKAGNQSVQVGEPYIRQRCPADKCSGQARCLADDGFLEVFVTIVAHQSVFIIADLRNTAYTAWSGLANSGSGSDCPLGGLHPITG